MSEWVTSSINARNINVAPINGVSILGISQFLGALQGTVICILAEREMLIAQDNTSRSIGIGTRAMSAGMDNMDCGDIAGKVRIV